MGQIAKPTQGATGWNTATDALIDDHNTNPLTNGGLALAGAAVGMVPTVTHVTTGSADQFKLVRPPELNLLAISPTIDRTGTTDARALLQAGLDAAAAASLFTIPSPVDGTTAIPVGATLVIPDGLYACASGLTWPQGVSVRMSPGARIKATASMAVLVDTSVSALSVDQSWTGGILDCNALATTALYARSFANLYLTDLTVWNSGGDAVILGDPAATNHAYEPIVRNLKVRRTKGQAVPSGSRGLWVQDATDGEFIGGIIVGADVGVRVDRGGCTFSHYHPWGYAGYEPSVNFDDNATGTTWIGCSADSPTTYGFRLRGSGARIVAPRFYRNANMTDNTGTAIYVDTAGASVSITGWRNAGNDSGHRWALDVDGAGADSINFIGKQDSNVVTSRGQNQFVQVSGKVVTTTRRASSGTADLEQWQDASGTVTAKIAGSGAFTAPTLTPAGLTGAIAAGRLVGFTDSGAPTSGTFVTGDVVYTQAGEVFVCTSGGSPGTWLRTHRPVSLHKSGSWHAPGTTFGTASTLGNGTLRVVPVQVHRPITISQLGVSVTGIGDSGSVFRCGVYGDANEYPGALLLDAGTVATDTTGDKAITGLSLVLAPGLYWLGGAVQLAPSVQPTLRAITSMPMTVAYGSSQPSSGLVFGYSHASVTGALPSTFASLGTNVIGSAARVAYLAA